MYAYYTLSAIAVVYLIFAVLSLKYGKWYYLFIHPFTFICGALVLHYRYASDIPSLAVHVDRMLAGCVLLASLMFWLGYITLKRETIEQFTTFWFAKRTSEENGIPTQKFWLYLIFIVLAFICYYICQYIKFGKFELMFFQVYDFHNKDLIQSINMKASLVIRTMNFIATKIFMILPFLALALLVETLRKHGKTYSCYVITTIFFILLVVMTGFFLFGYRSFVVYCVLSILFLIMPILLRLNTNQGLRKASMPIIIFILIYCSVFFVSLRPVRAYGINGLYAKLTNVFGSKESLQKSIKDNFFIQKQEKKSDAASDFNIVLNRSFLENNTSSQLNIEETEIKKNAKQYEYLKATELQYLMSKPAHGHRTSMEIGWIVAYFGRHEDYMGITIGPRTLMNNILPPPLGKDRSWISPFKKIELLGRGNAEGYFGEGYICYGIVGGYLYWGIAAFIFGILAKFTVTYLFSSPRLETTSLGLCLFCVIPTSFTSGYMLLYQFLYGFVMLGVGMFIILRFYDNIIVLKNSN
jgi:hypothetical protein